MTLSLLLFTLTINFLLYMDDFKLYVATEETVNHFNILFSNNIQKDMGTEL